MKPHIARWHDLSGLWLWAVWFCGLEMSRRKGSCWAQPDYTCSQLSVVKDIIRGRSIRT